MSLRLVNRETTLAMTVANTGFMLDRLGQDCSPLQFLRELTQNAIEAIHATPERTGEIVWDVDWDRFDLTSESKDYKLCVTDNGTGMTGDEMERFINQLSSSVHEQTLHGNFGVGAKIAAATRNHEGLIYLSWKDGAGSMIHLWRDPETAEYGLRQLEGPDGSFVHHHLIQDWLKPKMIHQHGTKVVLLGNHYDQNTMLAPDTASSPSRWMAKYLNTRYFRFPDGITVKAREGWEYARSDTDRNVLRTVLGQKRYLDGHCDASGSVRLTNAVAHWWILKGDEKLSQNSGSFNSNGHMAALFQDELYETLTGRAGVARLQQFGIIFGYNRVVIYVEPDSTDSQVVTSNTARTALILNGDPLMWADWAAEFRTLMPEKIQALMESEAAGAVSSDHKQSIRERLRLIRELFKPSKYHVTRNGSSAVDPDNLTPGGEVGDEETVRERKGHGRGGGTGGRAGDIYSLFLLEGGPSGEPIHSLDDPKAIWVTTRNGSRVEPLLEDRAAKYLVEQNIVMINADFRIFTDMVDRWCKQYSTVPGVRDTVEDVVREWFEQSLIETVLGVLSIKDSKLWTVANTESALSEEALTATVMPRYHIDIAIKRVLGNKLGTLNTTKERAS